MAYLSAALTIKAGKNLVNRRLDDAFSAAEPVAAVVAIRRDARRRAMGAVAVFDGVERTLGILSQHRLLKQDTQFLGLLDSLIGITDADEFFDRVAALQTYVNRVLQAHDIASPVMTADSPSTPMMRQRPTHLADPDDDSSRRTRLQVR